MSELEDSGAGSRRARRRWWLLLKFVFAAAVFYWLFSSKRLDLAALDGVLGRWHWLVAAEVGCLVIHPVLAWRWQLLLRVQGVALSFRECLCVTFIGVFFNQILLGSAGGDLYRAWFVARDNPQRRGVAVLSVVVDRVTALFTVLVIALFAAVLAWDTVTGDPVLTWLVGLVAVIVVVVVAGVVMLTWRPVRSLLGNLPCQDRLRSVKRALVAHFDHLPITIVVALLGAALCLLVVSVNVCLAYALFGGVPSVVQFLLVIPLALAAMALPINPPGALGTGEAIYDYLLDLVGVAGGSLLSLLQRLAILPWAIPGAVLYIVWRRRTNL